MAKGNSDKDLMQAWQKDLEHQIDEVKRQMIAAWSKIDENKREHSVIDRELEKIKTMMTEKIGAIQTKEEGRFTALETGMKNFATLISILTGLLGPLIIQYLRGK